MFCVVPSELYRQVGQTPHERVPEREVEPRLALLQDFQVRRLRQTYQDMLASPRYGPACEFFVQDVYAARDFSQRNYDLTRMHNFLRRWFPASFVRPLTLAVELHTLTEQLDHQLLDALVNPVGMTDTLTVPMYAEAYRICDNYAVRVHQIELIVEVGQGVEGLVNLPFSSTVIKLGREPARRAGWDELLSFLERGYAGFKHMRGAKGFLNTMRERELGILDRIYANSPDPFLFPLQVHRG